MTTSCPPIAWNNDCLEILDQTLLPEEVRFLQLGTIEAAFEAIQKLRVRGAPMIGITAAYGLYLGMRTTLAASAEEFFGILEEQVAYLSGARPTAVNLFWALQAVKSRLTKEAGGRSVSQLKARLLEIATEVHEDDRRRCDAMAEYGQEVIPHGARILTHCNTGALATGGIGTAFGVIHRAHLVGKQVHVYADETRPVLQGARLTMWELANAKIPSQLICDNMAAALMREGNVDLVIVGADRIATDGSAANKIGTYGVAVLAHYHKVPFYVAAPISTFDLAVHHGSEIPIEMRHEDEVRRVFGKTLITLPSAACWNPAFDVTPPELISGIVTERGIIRPPYRENIQAVAGREV